LCHSKQLLLAAVSRGQVPWPDELLNEVNALITGQMVQEVKNVTGC
jgi:hypothetical protein